jgi:hypothetical protein
MDPPHDELVGVCLERLGHGVNLKGNAFTRIRIFYLAQQRRSHRTNIGIMLQVLLALVQLFMIGVFSILAILFAVLAILRWRKKRPFYVQASIAAVSAAIVLGLWSIDLFSSESTDRTELVEAFRENFGIDPPPDIKEIKVKNTFIRDSFGHYMAFTYDRRVFDYIVERDQPLQTAYARTPEFNAIVQDAYVKDRNRPDWAVLPTDRTPRILYKKNFMDHSFSEYYLWVDTVESMVHLQVSYFD